MSELKPCPCCGSTYVGGAGGIVYCYACDLKVQRPTTEGAVKRWNNRQHENKIKAEAVREFGRAMKKHTGNVDYDAYARIHADKLEAEHE